MRFASSDAIDQLFWRIALKDDEEAFRSLFLEFFSSLCVFAHRHIDDWDTCEDIVQDTFFKIWKNRKSIEINSSCRNFLITSVRNSCIDYLRKQDLIREWQEKEIQEKAKYPLDDLYSRIELEQMLLKALAKLPENIRNVFELNRFEGKSYKEIAELQGVSVKTVESHISKALRILRTELRDYLPFLLLFFW